MKKLSFVVGLMFVIALLGIVGKAEATVSSNTDQYGAPYNLTYPSVVVSSAGQAAVTSSFTATGVLYNYITNITIVAYSTGTTAGTASPYTCTTTNLTGSMAFDFPTAAAIGTQTVLDLQFANPVKSSTAGQGSTVVCPSSAGVRWHIRMAGFYDN